MFRGPHQSRTAKIVQVSGGTGGSGGRGGANGGNGGPGHGPRVKIVAGRTVTNINEHYSNPTVPSSFRTIPLGDIDLQREIHLDGYSGVATLRRLYSAKIEGSGVARTVAIYHGDDAEEVRTVLRRCILVQIQAQSFRNG
ncbi:hypothetical protein C8R45DRAFT_1067748 [Mycena sanguinolenta]|nr:hypothetical protein C8R45DRAFT_1067748 [Mycena sanguinolenta]